MRSGCVVYLQQGKPNRAGDERKDYQQQGVGNCRPLFINIPDGKTDSIKLIPVLERELDLLLQGGLVLIHELKAGLPVRKVLTHWKSELCHMTLFPCRFKTASGSNRSQLLVPQAAACGRDNRERSRGR